MSLLEGRHPAWRPAHARTDASWVFRQPLGSRWHWNQAGLSGSLNTWLHSSHFEAASLCSKTWVLCKLYSSVLRVLLDPFYCAKLETILQPFSVAPKSRGAQLWILHDPALICKERHSLPMDCQVLSSAKQAIWHSWWLLGQPAHRQ